MVNQRVRNVEVDPMDIDGKSKEQRLEMALGAIRRNGFRPNGNPNYSFRQAAKDFHCDRSTLQERFKGRQTRQEASTKRQKLSPAQEDVLVEWAKEKGRRNIPLHATAVAQHASIISGCEIGENWVERFKTRHPDLKVKWASGLEKCRAASLNPAAIADMYTELEEIQKKYNIKDENKYNADEKGVQLGIGSKVKGFFDRDQATYKTLENGDRELVTVIECVCADGTAIPPSVIYKGARRDLEWGRDNPCNASISHSPKGWTDQELGSAWLEKDFEPFTRSKLESDDEYRLLILDGHNSHTTYRFCSFAERHKIIIFCLPPHTTHRTQPCDVGPFGPLSTAWKAQVTAASYQQIPIKKNNFISYYSRAREKAFTATTIINAWKRTGLVPLDPTAIPSEAYGGALNTTSQPAQPIPATLPPVLRRVDVDSPPNSEATISTESSSSESATAPVSVSSSSSEATGSLSTRDSSQESHVSSGDQNEIDRTRDDESMTALVNGDIFELVGLPPTSRPRASIKELREENRVLRELLESCRYHLTRLHALDKLKDKENGDLRQQLFNKCKKKKKNERTNLPRHLTSEEALRMLCQMECRAWMKEIFQDPKFKERRIKTDEICKQIADEAKERQKEAAKAAKEAEKTRKAAERERLREEKRAAAASLRAEKARLAAEKRAAKAAGKGKGKGLGRRRRSPTPVDDDSDFGASDTEDAWKEGSEHETDDLNEETVDDERRHAPERSETPPPPAPPPKPRPRPRPTYRTVQATIQTTVEESQNEAEVQEQQTRTRARPKPTVFQNLMQEMGPPRRSRRRAPTES